MIVQTGLGAWSPSSPGEWQTRCGNFVLEMRGGSYSVWGQAEFFSRAWEICKDVVSIARIDCVWPNGQSIPDPGYQGPPASYTLTPLNRATYCPAPYVPTPTVTAPPPAPPPSVTAPPPAPDVPPPAAPPAETVTLTRADGSTVEVPAAMVAETLLADTGLTPAVATIRVPNIWDSLDPTKASAFSYRGLATSLPSWMSDSYRAALAQSSPAVEDESMPPMPVDGGTAGPGWAWILAAAGAAYLVLGSGASKRRGRA